MIWRRFKVAGNTSLASLHYIIQIGQGWTDDYLHQFHIYGKDYGIAHNGGLSFSDNPHQVALDDFQFDIGDRFLYEYNFYDHWLHDIRIEEITEKVPRKKLPFCFNGKGIQGVTAFDVYEKQLELMQFVVKVNNSTTVDKLRPYIEALDSVMFNRQKINSDLAKLDLQNPSAEAYLILG
jgi:hypothetical protein